MSDTDTLVFMARLAEQSERYDDMIKFMKEVVEVSGQIGNEERNYLSVAYKNMVGTKRQAWRTLSNLERQQENEQRQRECREYKEKVEQELRTLCTDIIHLLDRYLILDSTASKDLTESQVFYLKMKGDYHRYIGEISDGNARTTASSNAEAAYKRATTMSKTLDPTHPIRLGLALNYSVFLYEIQGDTTKACELAQDSFDSAIGKLNTFGDEDELTYKDTTLIMQLLRDNLSLWTEKDSQDD